ncbi:MAG TPA: inorganic phosphate transporter [Thermoanaerobaculia bacterium]|nr:inorganic phosphate transporter [Thermoanaerobaculia bacterium]
MLAAGLVLLAGLLAYANGSNDISKSISTLVGSGVTNARTAVIWGSLWTVAGVLAAAFVSQALVATFSGVGFLGREPLSSGFPAAVAIGAISWVLFASRTGMPVSTTHAIAGALAGAGIAAQGAAALHWDVLARKVALPLGLSPLLSIAVVAAVFPLIGRAARRADTYCVCVERRELAPSGAVLTQAAGTSIGVGAVLARGADCDVAPAVAARVSVLGGLHWMSAALTAFARGLNDAPKIAALGVGAAAFFGIRGFAFYAALAAAMAAGSLLSGFRVVETLAAKVTPMSPAEGFAANLVTTILVGAASFAALPVSTTHVSTGAIVGIGIRRGTGFIRWKTVGEMAIAWLVTIPAAALVAAAALTLIPGR